MTADVDIVNTAASRISARASLATFNPASPPPYSAGPLAFNAGLNYVRLRQQLLRAAQWGFARKTAQLTQTGIWSQYNVPEPWLYKYAYPADCLKVRYLIPQWGGAGIVPNNFVSLGSGGYGFGHRGPSRAHRFLISYDDGGYPLLDSNGEPLLDSNGQWITQENTTPVKVILSNVRNAFAVYTVDVTDPDLWDPLFENAMVEGLASYLTMPLGGNVKMMQNFQQTAMRSVLEARAADGNEAIPTTDSTPDWIKVREREGFGFGDGGGMPWGFPEIGSWWGGYDNMNWGA